MNIDDEQSFILQKKKKKKIFSDSTDTLMKG